MHIVESRHCGRPEDTAVAVAVRRPASLNIQIYTRLITTAL